MHVIRCRNEKGEQASCSVLGEHNVPQHQCASFEREVGVLTTQHYFFDSTTGLFEPSSATIATISA